MTRPLCISPGFYAAFLGALLFFAPAAKAQQMTTYTYSPAERIGFAFYHLTNSIEPPYEDWIKTRPDYQNAKSNIRIMMLDKEQRRLKEGFAVYDPTSELIPVHTKANLVFFDNPEYVDDGNNDPDAPIKLMKIVFPHAREGELYFPFLIGNMWIAFVPSGPDTKMTYIVTRATYELLEKKLGIPEDMNRPDVMAEFVLRPVKADGGEPVEIEGVATWLMTGEIASVALLDNNGGRIWDHMNDWYVNKDEKELKQLYSK